VEVGVDSATTTRRNCAHAKAGCAARANRAQDASVAGRAPHQMVYGQAVVARDMSVVGRRPLATGKLLVGVGVGHVSGGVERRRNTKKFG